MLREEAEVPPQLLAVHPRPLPPSRGAADVHEPRAGTDADSPPGLLQPPAQVDLLGEHEERPVEAADLLERLAPEQQRGADQESPAAPPRPRQVPEHGGPYGSNRGSPGPPPGGETHRRRLRRAVEIMQLRGERTEGRVLRRTGDEALEGVADGPGVGVEHEHETTARRPQPLVAGGAIADVLGELDHPDAGETLSDELPGAVGRRVVDDDHLPSGAHDAGQAPLEVGARVEGDDDYGELVHVRASSEPSAAEAMPGSGRSGERRRILVALPYTPRPDARHGGKAFLPLLLRLAERHRLALVHLRLPGEEPVDAALRERCDLVESVELADPSAAPHRALRAVRVLARLATGTPVQVGDLASAEYAECLRGVAATWDPDVIQVELEAMAQYLDAVEDSSAPRVLVLHEPARRTADEVWRTARGLERLVGVLDARAWGVFERRVAGRADAVVVLTEADRDGAVGVAAGRPVHTIPLTLELPPEPLDPLGATPASIVFVAGFRHPPNVDAARRLALRILPLVRARRRDVTLYLVGDRPPAEIRALAGDGVVVTGGVDDVMPYLDRAAVVAAPLLVGGGMRVKVLEALAAGKALVATPRAVAGLALRDGQQALVADADAEFAEALLRVLDDPEERLRLATGARAWAAVHLDPALGLAAYERLYDEVLSRPRE
jgi:glycosyltransferase involved in cell wall biosynthesis